MSPSPILPYHLQLILQYIVPPSELQDPLPSHLLSRELVQRHVFLDIRPTDAASYLSWDAATRDRAIVLLESVRKPFDIESPLDVAYLADGENTFAHVDLRTLGVDGLRLVFEWEESDRSWKFHNLGLMPFPERTHSTLDRALSSFGMPVLELPSINPESPSDEDDDDDYWNSYGAHDDSSLEPTVHVSNADKDASDNEDAYWAQYASVQGTADSTIPTPPRVQTRKMPAPDEPLPIPGATMIRPRPGPRDPPSPSILALKLGQLDMHTSPWEIREVAPPRSPPDCSFDDMVSQHAETDPDGDASGSQHGSSSDRSILLSPSVSDRDVLQSSRYSEVGVGSADSVVSEPPKPHALKTAARSGPSGPEDDSVREVVRGAYRLWKAVHAGQGSQEDFARLVFDAIEGL